MIFDGKAFARGMEEQVKAKVVQSGGKIKIVSIVVGDDPASALYSRLKQKAAERVGIEFEIYHYTNATLDHLGEEIKRIGAQDEVTGVMVQLPIPVLQGQALKEVLSAIPLDKDVDGLRWMQSGTKPATVRAILSIIDEIAIGKTKFCILGSGGAVGAPLTHYLKEQGYQVSEVEWDTKNPEKLTQMAEVVVSCVGKPGIVTKEMVQSGVIAINVGMSENAGEIIGDIAVEVSEESSIYVPVQRGVGPVTIASLLLNATELYAKNRNRRST